MGVQRDVVELLAFLGLVHVAVHRLVRMVPDFGDFLPAIYGGIAFYAAIYFTALLVCPYIFKGVFSSMNYLQRHLWCMRCVCVCVCGQVFACVAVRVCAYMRQFVPTARGPVRV